MHRKKKVRAAFAGTVVLGSACLWAASVRGADVVFFDEVRGMKSVSLMTTQVDQLLWALGCIMDDGFQVMWSPFAAPTAGWADPTQMLLPFLVSMKSSFGMHAKSIDVIIDDRTFDLDGQSVPSAVPGVFADRPELKDSVRNAGLLFILAWLSQGVPIEPGSNIIEILFRILLAGNPSVHAMEMVVYQDGRPARIMVHGQDGCFLPRDAIMYLWRNASRNSEMVIETRMAIQLDFENDEYNMILPVSFVSGFHRCPFRVGLDLPGVRWPLSLTRYPIIQPAEDTCSDVSESWYRPDRMSPSDADLGERCWDLDYINDLDLIPIKGPGMHVSVLDPDFDCAETRAWLLLTVLRDSGFRLLDTVNRDGIPDVVDRYPVGPGFPWTTYDGGALLVAVQKRRLGIDAGAVISLLQYLLSQPQAVKQEELPGFNIKDIVSNVRIFVGDPSGGGKVEIGLPEFLRMIGAQWNKALAYSPPHNFIEDFPYLDLGEGAPVVFQLTADLAIPGIPVIPLSILAEAWAGYYLTNIYGVGSFFP